MAKKGKDTRPTRSKQKERSTKNKITQLENHLEMYPKDTNAERKLKSARAGKIRGDSNVHPTSPILHKYADGKVKRDDKRNPRNKRK